MDYFIAIADEMADQIEVTKQYDYHDGVAKRASEAKRASAARLYNILDKYDRPTLIKYKGDLYGVKYNTTLAYIYPVYPFGLGKRSEADG